MTYFNENKNNVKQFMPIIISISKFDLAHSRGTSVQLLIRHIINNFTCNTCDNFFHIMIDTACIIYGNEHHHTKCKKQQIRSVDILLIICVMSLVDQVMLQRAYTSRSFISLQLNLIIITLQCQGRFYSTQVYYEHINK